MPEPKDLYGSFGSVPDVAGGGQTGQRFGVRATPNDFGAQIGEAQERRGAMEVKVAQDEVERETKFAAQATEAKVNDDYATKYIPAATQLRNQYDQLQGQDKIHGYDGYVKGLQALNQNFSGGSKGLYEQQIWKKLTNERLASETESAKRELVASQIEFSNQAAIKRAEAEAGYAAENYNNPQIVDNSLKSIDSTITVQHIDNGIDPSSPEGQASIEEAQRGARGTVATGMIKNAVTRGDINEANKIRQQYGPFIPGPQQLQIDNTLHVENMKQIGIYGSQALQNGQKLPQAGGHPPAHVQSIVANTAQRNGINPNHALTVAYIESNMGQQLGTRGDIGQTGKGGDLPEQATNMVNEIKKSQDVATKTLGRQPEPWETYTCYQQGASGGPALLKAATENPAARAVDVLAPLYKDPKTALSAIVNNGGNATMTSGDYLSFIKKKYQDNEARALCVVPDPQKLEQFGPEGPTILSQKPAPTLGDNIAAAHNSTGEVVQPSATPRGALLNFDGKMPQMIARANEIPNLSVRKAVLEGIHNDRAQLASAAQSYSSTLINSAQHLAVDPGFTSMNQVPPDLMGELLSEHPETLNYLENKAQQNLTAKGGGSSHDMKEYGPGMYGLMRGINENKITSITELMKHLPSADGTGGDITIAGFDKLKTLLIKDPQTNSDAAMQTQAFKVIKRQLSGQDEVLGWPDPKGEELFSRALPKLFKAIEDGQAEGLTMGQLTDPDPKNQHWIGNAVQGLKRTPEQQNIDMMAASGEAPEKETVQKTNQSIDTTPFDKKEERSFSTIFAEYRQTDDPVKKRDLIKEAKRLGFLTPTAISQPLAPLR